MNCALLFEFLFPCKWAFFYISFLSVDYSALSQQSLKHGHGLHCNLAVAAAELFWRQNAMSVMCSIFS